jgi:hypothetical protein
MDGRCRIAPDGPPYTRHPTEPASGAPRFKDTTKTALPRSGGVLLHPTSLPGTGIGDLGPNARRFVEEVASMGLRWWQMLPIGPTGFGDSPYQSPSTFAGNPLLISLEDLVSRWAAHRPGDPGGVGGRAGGFRRSHPVEENASRPRRDALHPRLSVRSLRHIPEDARRRVARRLRDHSRRASEPTRADRGGSGIRP